MVIEALRASMKVMCVRLFGNRGMKVKKTRGERIRREEKWKSFNTIAFLFFLFQASQPFSFFKWL